MVFSDENPKSFHGLFDSLRKTDKNIDPPPLTKSGPERMPLGLLTI